MNIYLSKVFTRLARREGLTDVHICQAVAEMNRGQGKSGGWRSLLGFQAGKQAFFLYLFSKNRLDNIEDDEMKALKRLTKYYLTLKPTEIKAALQCGELKEVNYSEKKK